MPVPPGWDATGAAGARSPRPWHGRVWRIHKQRYDARDAAGSRIRSGRYHRGADLFPDDQVFTALYLALAPETAIAELTRHIRDIDPADLNGYHLTELHVELSAVLDFRDPAPFGITRDMLCRGLDRSIPQALAAAAYLLPVEGILAPSATVLGNNLIVFPDRLLPGSALTPLSHRAPRLGP